MQLKIYHTNDIHSHLENWPKIERFLQEKKATDDKALFFDIGDFIDRVHPLTEATAGQANTSLLNHIPYDAVTIGNNEGTTLSKEQLQHLYDDYTGDVLCANIQNTMSPFKDFVIYERDNEKIAVIALTVIFSQFYDLLDWETEEPIAALERVLASLPEDVSTIILLSHLGLPMDEKIAERYPEITLILGSHTHHLLEEGKFVNGVLLAACGRYGEYVGEVTLNFNSETIVSKEAIAHKVDNLVATTKDHLQTQLFFETGKQLLSQVVATRPHELTHSWYEESELSAFVNQSICEAVEADTFLVNAGIYLTDLPRGDITRFDIHQCLPHPLNPFVLSLTGNQLIFLARKIMEQADSLRDYPLRGYGFRGEVFGQILFPRITFDKKGYVLWDNTPIIRDKIYKVATTDTFIFAPLFPVIKELDVSLKSEQFIRNIVEGNLLNEKR